MMLKLTFLSLIACLGMTSAINAEAKPEPNPSLIEHGGYIINFTYQAEEPERAIPDQEVANAIIYGQVARCFKDRSISFQFIDENTIELIYRGASKEEAHTTMSKLSATLAPTTLGIHRVHPDSHLLAEKVAKGEQTVEGYKVAKETNITKEGKKLETQVLIHEKPELTHLDIERAQPDFHSETAIHVKLNTEGTLKMERFTRSLTPGKDRIATVVNGEVINCAVLQAEVLSSRFMISGLEDLEECTHLSVALHSQLDTTYKLTILSERSIQPLKK